MLTVTQFWNWAPTCPGLARASKSSQSARAGSWVAGPSPAKTAQTETTPAKALHPRRCWKPLPIVLICPVIACFLKMESKSINCLVLIPVSLARANGAGLPPRKAPVAWRPRRRLRGQRQLKPAFAAERRGGSERGGILPERGFCCRFGVDCITDWAELNRR